VERGSRPTKNFICRRGISLLNHLRERKTMGGEHYGGAGGGIGAQHCPTLDAHTSPYPEVAGSRNFEEKGWVTEEKR